MNELSNAEKTKLSHKTIHAFSNLFGPNDIVTSTFFDILIESIYDDTGNDLHLPDKTGQEANEGNLQDGKWDLPTRKIE